MQLNLSHSQGPGQTKAQEKGPVLLQGPLYRCWSGKQQETHVQRSIQRGTRSSPSSREPGKPGRRPDPIGPVPTDTSSSAVWSRGQSRGARWAETSADVSSGREAAHGAGWKD